MPTDSSPKTISDLCGLPPESFDTFMKDPVAQEKLSCVRFVTRDHPPEPLSHPVFPDPPSTLRQVEAHEIREIAAESARDLLEMLKQP